MTHTHPNPSSPGESDADRLRGLLATDALSIGLVSALAGDRPMTPVEEEALRDLQQRRGYEFYSDLLYAVTHQFFSPEIAKTLWQSILDHKNDLSDSLKRNVRIAVATLDYLSNVKGEMKLPTLINEERIAEIANLSMRDGLTGFFNHTTCLEVLELELRTCHRYGAVASLIMLDVDDFKVVNDRHGHQEGDRLLQELAVMIKETTRDSDICCRYGGEEFAVILPFTETAPASEIACRICQGAQQVRVGESNVSVSCGVATYSTETETAQALIAKADRGLYEAKRSGKNRAVTMT